MEVPDSSDKVCGAICQVHIVSITQYAEEMDILSKYQHKRKTCVVNRLAIKSEGLVHTPLIQNLLFQWHLCLPKAGLIMACSQGRGCYNGNH